MKNLLLIFILLTVSAFADYKQRLEVIDIPFQEATMLENSFDYKGLTFHAKQISEKEEESFFNESLLDDGFVSVLVTVTNNRRDKVALYGSLSTQDGAEKVNVQTLLEKYQVGRLKGLKVAINILSFGMQSIMPGGAAQEAENQGYDEAKKNNFNDKSLHTELLYPGDTVTGFVYFNKNTFNKSQTLDIPIQIMSLIEKEKVAINIQ